MMNEVDSRVAKYEVICSIVKFGLGSRILHTAKEGNITGGTVLLGKGTVNNRTLELLGLSDVRKELVFIVTDVNTAIETVHRLNKEFKFSKPNHGIIFTMPVLDYIGNSLGGDYQGGETVEERGVNSTMYQAIIAIVDKGKAEFVMNAATKAGSKGGTIINGRGSSIYETGKIFAMDIEPEKEVVLILSQNATTEAIVKEIREKLKINEPGNGVIFVQDVKNTYGLYE